MSHPALPRWGPRLVFVALLLLTLPFLAYVVVRMAYAPGIEYNEGWNTYHTARLLAGEPLYTPVQSELPLIPNNYPPTSFFVVGALSPLFGSIVMTGRIVSLVSMLLIAALVFVIVRRETGQALAAALGALLWLALLVFLANEWAASHEPQLLGHVLSTLALALYVRWKPGITTRRAVALALLVVAALTVKHILLPIPLTLGLVLLVNHRRAFWAYAATAVAAVAAFLAAWWLWTDGVFVSNVIDFDRQGTLARLRHEVGNLFRRDLVWPILLPALVIPWRATRSTWALLYFALSLGLGVYWSQGSGVSRNGWFDLFIAASILFGLMMGFLAKMGQTRQVLALVSAALILLPFAWGAWNDLSDVVDYAYLRQQDALYRDDVALLRSIEGPVLSEDILLTYDAGKDFLADPFLITQLMMAGRVPEAALLEPIQRQAFGAIVLNTDIRRRLRALAPDAPPNAPPQATAAERWTDNTLRAMDRYYQLLPVEGSAHYFYVPRR